MQEEKAYSGETNCGKEDEKNVHLERMKEICSELLDIDFKITRLREERRRLSVEQCTLAAALGIHLNNPLSPTGLETPGSMLLAMNQWPTTMPYMSSMPNPTYMQKPKQEENKKEENNNGNAGNDSGN